MASIGDVVTQLKSGITAIGSLTSKINTIFPQTVGTSGSCSAGSIPVPGSAVGFITITLPNNGGSAKIPYFGN